MLVEFISLLILKTFLLLGEIINLLIHGMFDWYWQWSEEHFRIVDKRLAV